MTLCYHAVSEAWNDPLAVSPDVFAWQVRSLLRRGLRAVDTAGVLAGERGTFHVTFDDAYAGIRPALELLASLRVPATVFACSALAEAGDPLVLAELAGRADGHEDELVTMGWDELAAVAEGPVEIGSHTVTHAHLPALADAELERELRGSRERIESALGRPCRLVAYPFGEHDARVRSAARAAGYSAGFGLGRRRGERGAFALPRVDVYRGTGSLRFRTRTSSLDAPARTAGALVRRVRRGR